MEKESIFKNKFDGGNCLNAATAQANNFTEIQIQLNYKGFY